MTNNIHVDFFIRMWLCFIFTLRKAKSLYILYSQHHSCCWLLNCALLLDQHATNWASLYRTFQCLNIVTLFLPCTLALSFLIDVVLTLSTHYSDTSWHLRSLTTLLWVANSPPDGPSSQQTSSTDNCPIEYDICKLNSLRWYEIDIIDREHLDNRLRFSISMGCIGKAATPCISTTNQQVTDIWLLAVPWALTSEMIRI